MHALAAELVQQADALLPQDCAEEENKPRYGASGDSKTLQERLQESWDGKTYYERLVVSTIQPADGNRPAMAATDVKAASAAAAEHSDGQPTALLPLDANAADSHQSPAPKSGAAAQKPAPTPSPLAGQPGNQQKFANPMFDGPSARSPHPTARTAPVPSPAQHPARKVGRPPLRAADTVTTRRSRLAAPQTTPPAASPLQGAGRDRGMRPSSSPAPRSSGAVRPGTPIARARPASSLAGAAPASDGKGNSKQSGRGSNPKQPSLSVAEEMLVSPPMAEQPTSAEAADLCRALGAAQAQLSAALADKLAALEINVRLQEEVQALQVMSQVIAAMCRQQDVMVCCVRCRCSNPTVIDDLGGG